MKIEEIEAEWAKDAVIKSTDLGSEALNIPRLHSKWYGILLNEKRIFHGLTVRKDELTILLEGYFGKTLTLEELKEAGLPDYSDKKILKPDIPKHIATHSEMIKLNLKIAVQSDKIEFLKDIIKTIHGRSFLIKDAIEFQKFQAGSY